MNPGKAKIQANAVLPGGQRFTATVEVSGEFSLNSMENYHGTIFSLLVFRTLEVISPKRITTDSILMPPRTSIHLKANLDDVSYKLDADASGIVTVTSDGIVKSRDSLGRDMIIVSTVHQSLQQFTSSLPTGENIRTNTTDWH